MGSGPAVSSQYLDLEAAVLRLVEQDPFASIQELKTAINNRPGGLQTSWWEVFGLLRRHKLLTKRSRFKYILGRR